MFEKNKKIINYLPHLILKDSIINIYISRLEFKKKKIIQTHNSLIIVWTNNEKQLKQK